MKGLIIGKGQVGTSLYNVLKDVHETYIKDVEDLELDGVEILHLCYPYTEKFIEIANGYINKYQPKLTINHASVPIGTTENLVGQKCYSPIRGKHPHLEKGILTFDKFIAGDLEPLQMAEQYFRKCGITTIGYDATKIRTLEYCKLMSNIRYGYEICFFQEAERIAKNLGADIETFKFFEESYNLGYIKLGELNMRRPILFGGAIGGHCVMHNADIIQEQSPSEMIDWMRFSNYKRRMELEREDLTK